MHEGNRQRDASDADYNVVQQTAPQAVVEHWRCVLTTGQITGHLAKVVALQAEITAKKSLLNTSSAF